MIFLQVREDGDEKEPMGFNCGPSDVQRAQWIAEDLRSHLKGNLTTYGPERTNGGDYIVTVMCGPGNRKATTSLVEMSVAIWRARGQLGD